MNIYYLFILKSLMWRFALYFPLILDEYLNTANFLKKLICIPKVTQTVFSNSPGIKRRRPLQLCEKIICHECNALYIIIWVERINEH